MAAVADKSPRPPGSTWGGQAKMATGSALVCTIALSLCLSQFFFVIFLSLYPLNYGIVWYWFW